MSANDTAARLAREADALGCRPSRMSPALAMAVDALARDDAEWEALNTAAKTGGESAVAEELRQRGVSPDRLHAELEESRRIRRALP